MKFCFVFSSDGDAAYAYSTYICAYAARLLHPQSEVVLISDTKSIASFPIDAEEKVFNVKEILDIREGNAAFRSRFLKTQMRNLVHGDFLFVDSDALIVSSVSEIFSCKSPIALCQDRNWDSIEPSFPDWVAPLYNQMEWKYPTRKYFNSGVFFMKDTDALRTLSSVWHNSWYSLYKQHGVVQDQPSLNHVIDSCGIEIHELSTRYNAPISVSYKFSRDAKIFHYFLSKKAQYNTSYTLLWKLMEQFRKSGDIDESLILQAGKKWDPFVHPTDNLSIEFYYGYYRSFARLLASKACRRIKEKFTVKL